LASACGCRRLPAAACEQTCVVRMNCVHHCGLPDLEGLVFRVYEDAFLTYEDANLT
jgi:hypothetical protein